MNYFDNTLAPYAGEHPSLCTMRSVCGDGLVMEHNGVEKLLVGVDNDAFISVFDTDFQGCSGLGPQVGSGYTFSELIDFAGGKHLLIRGVGSLAHYSFFNPALEMTGQRHLGFTELCKTDDSLGAFLFRNLPKVSNSLDVW